MKEPAEGHHRLVVKLGTNLLTGGSDHLDLGTMANLLGQIASLHHRGLELILVSSGAIAAGRHRLGLVKEQKSIPFKQVLASVGQSHLMNAYEQLFSWHSITTAQALLTKADLSDRAGYLNARNTLLALMELRVICIVNENDVVAIDEIHEAKFGDNDNLSAMVANLVDADLLVLLTDTGGLYTADPLRDSSAQLIQRVDRIDTEIEHLASTDGSQKGVGGMSTKIEAAKLATASGVTVVIANGLEPNVILRLVAGETIGTLFPPITSKLESRKRWMLGGLSAKGKLTVDSGAVFALSKQSKSLLPSGIKGVEGDFQRGEKVNLLDPRGNQIGYGISNYSSSDIAIIKGAQSEQVSELLGYEYGAEVIHRDNMVML